MASPAFSRIYAKVTRAEQHIQDFHLGLRAFFDTNPYGVSVEERADGFNASYYVSKIGPVPDTLAAIAADVVSNLRSALDNLSHQLVLDAHGGTKPKWKVYFPISKTAADYKETRGGCMKGARQEIADAIDATGPYKVGKGHGLWQLQQLSNIDKHEFPLEAAASFGSVDVSVEIEHGFRQMPGFEHIRVPPLSSAPRTSSFP